MRAGRFEDMIREDPEMNRLKNVPGGLTDELYKLKDKTEEQSSPFISSMLRLNEKKVVELRDFQEAVAQV